MPAKTQEPRTDDLVLVIDQENSAGSLLSDYLSEGLGNGIPRVQRRGNAQDGHFQSSEQLAVPHILLLGARIIQAWLNAKLVKISSYRDQQGATH
jgi:hypothetical protein